MEGLKNAEAIAPQLGSVTALWHFGRACNSLLARDILLDSVIGLEGLLVPKGGGEVTYKLEIHGVALLGEEIGNTLKKVYGLRSDAAHGASTKASDFSASAPKARQILAKAIWAVVQRINDGTLDVGTDKPDVGGAIKRFVRTKLGS